MKTARLSRPGGSTRTSPQPQTSPRRRILVVDDDVSILHVNTTALTQSGYEVAIAGNGAAAWQALNADSYDLVITDNNMPTMTGVELLKKLRAARMTMPVIMATGTLPKEEFSRTPWLQPDATLAKPYSVAELLRTVKKVLRGAHSILVVDSDSDVRRLYADALASPGYDVELAEDGAAAWEALQANPYNLLITEHELPGLTGVELIEKLRAARMALPVVMAAARLPMHELARNPSLQLAATLSKPFAVDALQDTVKNVLRATDGPGPIGRERPPSTDGLWQV